MTKNFPSEKTQKLYHRSCVFDWVIWGICLIGAAASAAIGDYGYIGWILMACMGVREARSWRKCAYDNLHLLGKMSEVVKTQQNLIDHLDKQLGIVPKTPAEIKH